MYSMQGLEFSKDQTRALCGENTALITREVPK